MDEDLEQQLEACYAIYAYLAERDLMVDEHFEQLVTGIAGRSSETFYAIIQLTANNSSRQAAKLCRSLFEDMVVAHWLVLHEDDPGFLIQRHMDQLKAIRLVEAKLHGKHGREADVSDLAGREKELEDTFGEWAEKDWWAVRRDGSPIGLPGVIEAIAESDRFHPRLRGEKPILEEMFDVAQKWNNQQLHNTPAGLAIFLNPDDPRKPGIMPEPPPLNVLGQAYWTFGQQGLLVLDVIPNQDWREFEQLFLAGLYEAFVPPDVPRPQA